ncbi:MAG: hypothetical protein JNL24_06015 [Bacteroidia bacterium]|nr:hypothetical protein [Bacteroidia bacterium]
MKQEAISELIHSMSSSEKRHFKIYSKGHIKEGENNYISLFDAINNSKKAYEHELKTKNSKRSSLKNLHVEKNYLYNLLLKSLNDFHGITSSEAKIDKINKHIEILLHKGLHQQCLKLVAKAKKTAYEAHAESQLIRTLELEQEIYNKQQDYKKLLSSIDDSKSLLKKLANQYDYKNLAFEMNFKEITFRSTNKTEHLKELQLLMKHELMLDERKAETYKAKMFLFQTKAMYYGIVNDEPTSILYFEKMMQLMESAPKLIQQHPIDYLLVFANVAMGKINLKNYKELMGDIKNIESSPSRLQIKQDKAFEANLFFFTKPYQLDIYTAIKEYEKSREIILLIEDHIDTYKPHVIRTILLNTAKSIAIASFYLEDYKRSLKYMNQIFDDDLGKYSRGHIFNMIIHYELGNESLLSSLINSTKRLLIQQDRLTKAEELMIEFFTKLIKKNKTKDIKTHFQDYHKLVLRLMDDPESNFSLRYFDVAKWMEAKIKNKSMASL